MERSELIRAYDRLQAIHGGEDLRSILWGGCQILLEEGDYTRENKLENLRYGYIHQIYWALVTAGYLAWSFLTNGWHRTWIVWPVAAVAYGAVVGIAKALRRRDG